MALKPGRHDRTWTGFMERTIKSQGFTPCNQLHGFKITLGNSVVGRCREANVVDRSWILAIFLKKRESQSLSYGLRKTSLALARDSLLLGPDNSPSVLRTLRRLTPCN